MKTSFSFNDIGIVILKTLANYLMKNFNNILFDKNFTKFFFP